MGLLIENGKWKMRLLIEKVKYYDEVDNSTTKKSRKSK